MGAAVATTRAQCPRCGTASVRVHSRYRRRLADAAVAGRTLVLRLERQFFGRANLDLLRKRILLTHAGGGQKSPRS
ncbi:transposase family protein [Nocardia sp. NPDC052278]|uniref:transposase family protein n=1 Tax=unclassified Nocardia TaxID=2637762 RepID=UPI003698B141